MFFRNLFLQRIPADVAEDMKRLPEAITHHRLRECGPMELGTKGFVAAVGRGEDAELAHTVLGSMMFAIGTSEKLLPAAVVNDELQRRVNKIAEEEGRKVGGRERKRLKEDVLTDLVPRAFLRSNRVAGYADLTEGWLVLNTSSRKAGEAITSMIREALGSFPVLPLAPANGPRVLMTDWLANGELPVGLALGDECELRDPALATGAISRNRRQDLDSEEIKEHLRNGKQVFQLGLVFDERLSFVLGEDLVIRKLKFLDVVTDELGDSHADAAAEADATFVLMTAELQRLLGKLDEWFGLGRDDPLHLHQQDIPAEMRPIERNYAVERAAQRMEDLARDHGVTTTIEHGGEVLATFGDGPDPLLENAIAFVRSTKRASISSVQRHFRIGYNRGARLIEELEKLGVVSAPEQNGVRHVLPGRVAKAQTSTS